MKYILTVQAGDSFASVNTLLLEGELERMDDEDELKMILRAVGYSKGQADYIVDEGLYFWRSTLDTDFDYQDSFITEDEQEVDWEEYKKSLIK